jgi:predicted RNA binding protein YcfA (HicA-like mRNA interferase family)
MNGFEKLVKELLSKNGFYFFRSGKGSHEIWLHADGRQVTVNHACKSRHTANAIMKEAGIKHKF